MDSNIRSWLAWLLPFLVSGGMALGAFIGMTSILGAARQEGPAGDMAGAAGALMIVICIVAGVRHGDADDHCCKSATPQHF
jgi:hypothetical protein